MKLFRKEEEEEEEVLKTESTKRKRPSKASDALIADTGMLTFRQWKGLINEACSRELEGEEGFKFKVSYAGIFGCRVAVSLKFNNHISSGSDSDSSPISICGIVAAYLNLADSRDQRVMRLMDRDCEEPVQVAIGKSIPLDRSVTLAPIGSSYLAIEFKLFCSTTHDILAEGYFPFAFRICDAHMFATNRQRSHTKTHPDQIISVTIDILHAGEEYNMSD